MPDIHLLNRCRRGRTAHSPTRRRCATSGALRNAFAALMMIQVAAAVRHAITLPRNLAMLDA
ncbi:hypothetical protein WS66_28245 [Burkholderia sp. LA-2-3-30-S1-D2]|nr:hypothetical protein WS66_28245 [Burkholderia sp. LA-2-3-30-S1-D2]KVE14407.1 hypothetical protein WS66_12555 [Burkholderia sp. LA-2-3-30-S1-D2]